MLGTGTLSAESTLSSAVAPQLEAPDWLCACSASSAVQV